MICTPVLCIVIQTDITTTLLLLCNLVIIPETLILIKSGMCFCFYEYLYTLYKKELLFLTHLGYIKSTRIREKSVELVVTRALCASYVIHYEY